jgi:integrative and conjugative element protein (TIGR02256 family)
VASSAATNLWLPHLRGAVSTREPDRIRRIHLAASAANTITREAGQSADGNETGGILLGHLRPDGTADVTHAGEPGPAAVRTPTFFLRDLDHARWLAAETFARDASTWIGEWHTHPAIPALPSTRDLDTYTRLLADPELNFTVIVAVILTAGPTGWKAPLARGWACYPDRTEPVPITADKPKSRILPTALDRGGRTT